MSDGQQTFFNSALNGILTVTDDNEYILSRPLTRSEMLDALHYCQDGNASCLFTLKLFEAHELASMENYCRAVEGSL